MPTRGERIRLLAGLLAAPGEESLATLGGLEGQFEWLAGALRELEDQPLEEWQAEHCRLFINGVPRTPCLPFQSAQLEGQMQGPSVIKLNALYRRLGLEAQEISPDYLGTMLECAAYLDEADPPQAEAKATLWQDHLLRWLPEYAEKLQSESQLALYRELGRELAELCREESDV